MKTVLITGANRGLGLEWARQYLEEGSRILACCRNPSKAVELEALGSLGSGSLEIFELDVACASSIGRLVERLSAEAPELDILINNAGIGGDVFQGTPDAETMERLFKVNTVAPLMVTRALYPFLKKASGSIVAHMSSLLGSIGHKAELPKGGYAYSVSKAGLNMATMVMSLEYEEAGIIVLSLSPGWVQTDMGGDEAPLSAVESISGLRKVLDSVSLEQSGSYWHYDGTEIPW